MSKNKVIEIFNYNPNNPFLVLDLDNKHCVVGKQIKKWKPGFNGS